MTEERFNQAENPGPRVPVPALRAAWDDTRAFVARPRYWALTIGGVFITALAGPFYTLERLTFIERLLYWGLLIVLSGFLLSMLSMLALRLNDRGRVHWVLAVTLATLLAVPPILAMTYWLDWVTQGTALADQNWWLVLSVGLPMWVVNLLVNWFVVVERRDTLRPSDFAARFRGRPVLVSDSGAAGDATEGAAGAPAPLLFEKLPEPLGRDLVCLQAKDHYVEATTTKGSALVLIRLSDAERDLSWFDGMRVHRSWWVNLDHVAEFARTEGGGMALTTTTGLSIPVARGQRAALKAALDTRRAAAE